MTEEEVLQEKFHKLQEIDTRYQKLNEVFFDRVCNPEVSGEELKGLVELGANVNTMQNGRTPLTEALSRSDNAKVKFLMENGANANLAVSNGYTPLMFAANVEAVKLLIDAGADVYVKDFEGKTAAERVASAGRNDLAVEILAAARKRIEGHETAIGQSGGGFNGLSDELLTYQYNSMLAKTEEALLGYINGLGAENIEAQEKFNERVEKRGKSEKKRDSQKKTVAVSMIIDQKKRKVK